MPENRGLRASPPAKSRRDVVFDSPLVKKFRLRYGRCARERVCVCVTRTGEIRRKRMILTTTETISGRELEMLGLVKGSTIQTVNAFRDIGAGLKNLVGGELKKYNEMMNDARALATRRMVEEAEAMGADAVVCVRYASASVMQSAAEVMAYGTAVKFK